MDGTTRVDQLTDDEIRQVFQPEAGQFPVEQLRAYLTILTVVADAIHELGVVATETLRATLVDVSNGRISDVTFRMIVDKLVQSNIVTEFGPLLICNCVIADLDIELH